MMATFSAPQTTHSLDAARVYERYIALNSLAAECMGGTMGGRLILYGNVDEHGAASAVAGNIAGATTLGISPDKEALKQAIRNGVCDFMVNSLDEALRILKNEIRKKQAVSVCLGQRFDQAMREIATRGVQPDILALASQEWDASAVETTLLLQRGAAKLPLSQVGVSSQRVGVHWGVANFPALWLPKVDAVAAEVLGDELRCRWLRLAPRYLGRRAHSIRYVEMTADEIESFIRVVRKMLEDCLLETAVTVQFGGREERLAPMTEI